MNVFPKAFILKQKILKLYLKKIHFKTANRESGALHADLPRGVHDALMVAPAKQEMIGWSPGPDTEFFHENMI